MNGFDVGTVLTIRTTSTVRDYTVTLSNGHRTELVGRRGARRVLVGVPQSEEWSIIEECTDRPRSRPCSIESFMRPAADELTIAPEADGFDVVSMDTIRLRTTLGADSVTTEVVTESPLHSPGYGAGYAACVRGEDWAQHADRDWDLGYCAAVKHLDEHDIGPAQRLRQQDESPGLKYDDGKPQLGRVPIEAMAACARIIKHGADKYGDDNWRKVRPAVRWFDGVLRHIYAHLSGEDLDADGLNNLDCALTSLAFLAALRDAGVDTRTRG